MEKTEKEKESAIKPMASVKSPARDAHLRDGKGFSLAEIKAAGHNIQTLKALGIKIDYLRRTIHDFNVKLLKEIKLPEIKKKEKAPYKSKEERIEIRKSKIAKKPKPIKKVEIVREKEKIVEEEPLKAEEEVVEEKPIEIEEFAIEAEPEPIPKEKVTIKTKKPIKTKIPAKEEIELEKVEEPEPIPKEIVKIKTKKPIKTKIPAMEEVDEIVEKKEVKAEGIPLTELPGLGKVTAKKFNEIGVNTVEELCEEDPAELATLIEVFSVERIQKWVEEGKKLLNK